jgi:hypothetical protein
MGGDAVGFPLCGRSIHGENCGTLFACHAFVLSKILPPKYTYFAINSLDRQQAINIYCGQLLGSEPFIDITAKNGETLCMHC